MTWAVFRWVWQLESPLYIGMPPAGSLNRTRSYVPGRVMWGALTAELARHAVLFAMQEYKKVGDQLRDDYRFTYLFPAQQAADIWRAWLPTYREGRGLCWHREDDLNGEFLDERAFRRRLLHTRPGTAISANTDTADEGSLRETECIQSHWRDAQGNDAGPVAMVGYVFIETDKPKDKYSSERKRLDPIQTLFLGGDTRYGLGRVRRGFFEPAREVFGSEVSLDGVEPRILSTHVLAHASSTDRDMIGAQEMLLGWDHRKMQANGKVLWSPGSRLRDEQTKKRSWKVTAEGRWEEETNV